MAQPKVTLPNGLPQGAKVTDISKALTGKKEKQQSMVAKGLGQAFPAGASANIAPSDPISETQMILTLDDIRVYEKNPRTGANPNYHSIKESIRDVGLKQPLIVTRRPGEDFYVLSHGGGTRLKELCGVSARAGRAGFEFLEGIPGTIGGSLRMNAGAMGDWIFDVVESIEWLTPQGRVRAARRDCFDALYRDCPQLHGAVVLSAVLRSASADDATAIRGRMDEMAVRRRASQPREASAGCVFRNPEGDKAGRLIDLSGLKGRAVGPVSVSPTHANFLVNAGEAKAADFLALMRAVRAEVKARQGVELQPEIVALGREWKDLL